MMVVAEMVETRARAVTIIVPAIALCILIPKLDSITSCVAFSLYESDDMDRKMGSDFL
jgi:hypothetical protein